MSKVVYSAIRTPDGTVLQSRHQHDYVTHKDKNGELYMLDGGLAYTRRSLHKEPAEDLSLTLDDPHSKLREAVSWGSRGIHGRSPLKYILVKDMVNEHIEAVTELNGVHKGILEVLYNELKYRENNNISIKD